MPKQRKLKRSSKRRVGGRTDPIYKVPRASQNILSCQVTSQSILSSSAAGIIAYSFNLGSVAYTSSDFGDAATLFNRWAVLSSEIQICRISNAAVLYAQPLFVGYINDGSLNIPTSAPGVLALQGAKTLNPLSTQPFTANVKARPKATQDPWIPTNGATAAQQIQYGGYVCYSPTNTNSVAVWNVTIRTTITFIDKN
jgi:hypothetical protein